MGLESNPLGWIEPRGPSERRSEPRPKKSKAVAQVEEGLGIAGQPPTVTLHPTHRQRSISQIAAP